MYTLYSKLYSRGLNLLPDYGNNNRWLNFYACNFSQFFQQQQCLYSLQQLSSIRQIKNKYMQTNLWNIRNSKQRLGIRERTQAQKRHLIGLVQAKAKLDDKNKEWRLKSLNADYNKRIKQAIHRDNRELVERIWRAEKSQSARTKSSDSKKFTKITENLKVVSSINRFMKFKLIQQQNGRMFNRLANTSATLSRNTWRQGSLQNTKYKMNISRTKYTNPDYSREVSNVIKKRKMTFKHLKLSRMESAGSDTSMVSTKPLVSIRA